MAAVIDPARRRHRRTGRSPAGAGRVRGRRRCWSLAAIAVALLALLPLGFVVGYDGRADRLGRASRLVFRPRIAELLWNTARLTVGSVALCLVLGVGAAWLVERTDAARPSRVDVLLVAPLAVPAFVNSFGWISSLPGLDSYAGALLIVTLSYFPFVYLPVAAALRGLDPALEEAATRSGSGRWARLPPGGAAAAAAGAARRRLLVALHLLAEFGALQMLRYPTFTTAIYDQYRSTFNGPAATMLAGVLVLLLPAAAAGRVSAARARAVRAARRRRGPAGRPGAGSARRRWPRAGRARPRSSCWRWGCRWPASCTGCSPAPRPASTRAGCCQRDRHAR